MVYPINDFPVSIEDVCNTNTIYGFDFPPLKGKTFRQHPDCVQTEYIEVPDSLRERIGDLTVEDYVIFLDGIPFVVIVFSGVNFTTVEYVIQRLKTVLANSIGKIFQFYKNNGYTIKTFLIDSEF